MAVDYFTNPPPGLNLAESRTATNNAIGIVLFALSFVFVGLRLYTRKRVKREPLGLDDYLMFLGLALNAGNLACCIAGGFFGLGKHIWSLGPYEMRKITIITFAYVFIYSWSVCIIKFSILALYRRIFGLTWLGWFCIAITTGYLITNHIVLPLYTRPLNFYWNQWYGGKGVVLVNEAKFYLGISIINLFGDVCILAIPIANVRKLNMGRSQKVAVNLTFLLGSFVCLLHFTASSPSIALSIRRTSVGPRVTCLSGHPHEQPLSTHAIYAQIFASLGIARPLVGPPRNDIQEAHAEDKDQGSIGKYGCGYRESGGPKVMDEVKD
ncbi:hypothetical protein P3342_013196 [Pyrenophora teres f. teres]|nr:hypothetical protein P3342_013196 [Pyrenophora teres f. teres]